MQPSLGCRCVVKITRRAKVETVPEFGAPWAPTGITIRGKRGVVARVFEHRQAQGWTPRVRKMGRMAR